MKMPFASVAPALLMSSALAVVWAAPAVAQTATQTPAPQQKPDTRTEAQKKADAEKAAATPEDVTTVTVTGAKPAAKIDRDIYDPKTDPDTPTSSASDVLNKAPGVSVDPEGNVTLRGNSGVQILVDGKPSALMGGNFRAGSLQSMPGDDIDTIEVMTSPSAQFGAEGDAGIINIVMKKNRSPRPQLSFQLNAGSEGRYRVGINGGIGKGKALFTGGLNLNHNVSEGGSLSERERIRDGVSTFSNSSNNSRNVTDTYGVVAGVDINVNDKDSVGAQFTYNKNERDSRSQGLTEDTNAAGVVTNRYTTDSRNTGDNSQGSARFTFNHKGDTEGEAFKANVSLSNTEQTNDRWSDNVYTDAARNRRTLRIGDESSKNIDISFDYNRKLWGGDLATGLEFNVNRNESDNDEYNINTSTGASVRDLNRSTAFDVDQDQTEAYVTYQRTLGEKWIVLGGLRAEHTQVTTSLLYFAPDMSDPAIPVASRPLVQTISNGQSDYTNYHPNFGLQYYLSEKSKLRYNYSHRIRRPGATELNGRIVYQDERNARSGNPDLKPSESHRNELRYEYNDRPKNLTFTTTLFYTKSENIFVDRSVYIDTDLYKNVLLTRRENGAEGEEVGLDFNFNMNRIANKWDINLQSTVKHEKMPPRSSTVTSITEADSISGRARINYRVTQKDQVQLQVNAQGKQLTGQGYNEPLYTANLSYSHKFNNKFTLTANIQDVFDSSTRRSIIDTDTVKGVTENRFGGGRTFMIGLRINPFGFGGDNPREGGPREGGPRVRGQGGNWGGSGGGNFGGPGGGF